MTEIHMKNQAVDAWIDMAIDAWANEYPDRAKIYRRMVADRASQLVSTSGVTRGGTMAYTGMVPAELFIVIQRKFPDFFQTPRHVERFYKIMLGHHKPKPGRNFFLIER